MRLVVVGGGGHASDVLGLVEDINLEQSTADRRIEVVGLLADEPVDMARFHRRGVEQVGKISDIESIDATHYVIAIGWPKSRQAVAERIPSSLTAATLVHPDAALGFGCSVGGGTVILGGARLSPLCTIGRHACIHHGVLLGHDCDVADFASIMPGAVISGDSNLEVACMIGTNACVIQGVTVGQGAIVGAGAAVIRDVEAHSTVVGVPAKPR